MWKLQKPTRAGIEQAIKTGVAGTLALYLAQLLHLPQGYWATMSACIVLQSDAPSTLSVSWDRLIGTAIGAVTGAAFVRFGGTGAVWLGLAAIITILLCEILGTETSYRIACVTAVIVMYVHAPAGPWRIGWDRFLEVALGIVVALIVAVVAPGKKVAAG
jgi:uncharacterized membrane protein YgaE (UPF0421/DUF939 family)